MSLRWNSGFRRSVILFSLTSSSLIQLSMMQDLSSLGITALGPRRKIVCAIQELRKPAPTAQQTAAMQEGQSLSDLVLISSCVDTLQGKTIITSASIYAN